MAIRVKEGRYSGQDRISFLPEEIIEQILVCLPLKEAARTSILSKKWKYIWTRLPELLLDESLCKNMEIIHKGDKLQDIISQVLLRCTGSIRKFTFSLSGLMNSDIDWILHSVCNKAMKDFNLDVHIDIHYKVGAAFFSCRQLENLYLGCCKFRPPPGFNGFSMLTSLKLYEVVISEKVCSSLISNCPKLEKLTLELLISCHHLDIVALNLKFFYCDGFFADLHFKDTPQLEILDVKLGKTWHQRKAAETAEFSFPSLKYAELNNYFLELMIPGNIPERFQHHLANLKAIKLQGFSFQEIDEAKRVLCLVRSCPNLEKITIDAWTFKAASKRAVVAFKTGCVSDLSLNKLREVVMVSVSGKRFEMLLIEILLANASALEKMVIEAEASSLLTMEESSRILGKVMQFPCASPRVSIKYNHPPPYKKHIEESTIID